MGILDFFTQRESVKLEDIGIYLRLVHLDNNLSSNDEIARHICEQFNVNCTARDIEEYELLHIASEKEEHVLREEFELNNM